MHVKTIGLYITYKDNERQLKKFKFLLPEYVI